MLKKYSLITLFLLVFLLIPKSAYADMIPETALPKLVVFMGGVVLLMSLPLAFINALIEFAIAFGILRSKLKNAKSLFKAELIVNLITTPPTLLLAWIILGLVRSQSRSFEVFHSPHPEIYLAEMIPFVAEFFLLKWQFNKLLQRGILIEQLTNNSLTFLTVITNLATFLLSLIFSSENIRLF